MIPVAIGMLLGAAFLLLTRRGEQVVGSIEGGEPEAGYLFSMPIDAMLPGSSWTPPAAAAPYLGAIQAAERAYGLPSMLLARLLYQESRYRPDIISGATRSSAGAVGIAQFMPATAAELGIDPRDPWSSIDAAGRYLAQLYRRFGDWALALAAYNWGQGNVARSGLAAAPAETRAYYSQILSDVGLA